MPRARNLKPALFKNEDLGTADPLLTILFTSLWCLADREGILEDRPLRIKAETFPYRDVDVNGYLTELERLGFIWRYKDGETALIQVCKFGEHQHPHNTEKPTVYLTYKAVMALTVKQPLDNGCNPSDSLNTDSLNTEGVSASPKKPKPPKADKKQNLAADARAQHPAIQAIRKLRRSYPDKDLWDRIIKRFGDNVAEEKLEACWLEWKERGYNKESLKWLNWYFDGIPAQAGVATTVSAPTKPKGPTNRQQIAEEQARIRMENAATVH